MMPEPRTPETEELQLQRFVDEEMSPQEERAYLGAVGEDLSAWREMALAFVEDRRWRRGIERYCAREEDDVPASVPCRLSREAGPARRMAVAAVFAVSAAVLGFLLGDRTSRSEGAERDTASGVEQAISGGRADERVSSEYRLRLLASDPEGKAGAFELLVATAEEIDDRLSGGAEMTKAFDLPPEWKARGYAAHWRTGMVTGDLGDGRQLVVPVGSPDIRYVGQ